MKPIIALFIILGMSLAAGTANAEEEALFSSQSLTPETAMKAAMAAINKCRSEGFQVAVAVVDRMGILQALLRDYATVTLERIPRTQPRARRGQLLASVATLPI